LQQGRAKKQLYLKLLENNNIRNARTVHFTAESERQQALEVFPELKHHIIPLGIHMPMQIRDAATKLRQRYKLDDSKPVIMFLSRIHPKKGLELLLESLAQNAGGAQLLIAGDGDPQYLDLLQQLVEKHKLQQDVKFVGFVQGTEKNLLLQGADLFALTSYSENFGIVVIEALAAGTPVLLTRPVALSAAVEDAKLGYVAETNIASVSAALKAALEDIDNGISYRQQAMDYVKSQHDWPTIGKQLNSMYEKIISSAE
jgi:glycosyltransferase involved in cell wall biosynthesis